MRKYFYLLLAILIVGSHIYNVSAATVLFPTGGGLGTSTVPQPGQVPIGFGNNLYGPGYITCASGCTIATSSGGITITGTGGGGGSSSIVFYANGQLYLTSSTIGYTGTAPIKLSTSTDGTYSLSLQLNGNSNVTCTANQFLNSISATGTAACGSISFPAVPATSTITAQGVTSTGAPNFNFATSGPMLAITVSGQTVTFTMSSSSLNLGTAGSKATTDFLQVVNNLSDLNNTSTARTNLGLNNTNQTCGAGTFVNALSATTTIGCVTPAGGVATSSTGVYTPGNLAFFTNSSTLSASTTLSLNAITGLLTSLNGITGSSTFNWGGNANVSGTTALVGALTGLSATLSSFLNVNGALNVTSTSNLQGAVNVSSTLTVQSTATVRGNLILPNAVCNATNNFYASDSGGIVTCTQLSGSLPLTTLTSTSTNASTTSGTYVSIATSTFTLASSTNVLAVISGTAEGTGTANSCLLSLFVDGVDQDIYGNGLGNTAGIVGSFGSVSFSYITATLSAATHNLTLRMKTTGGVTPVCFSSISNYSVNTISGNAVATPAGSDTQIQVNNGGSMGAFSSLTYNSSTGVFASATGTFSGGLTVSGVASTSKLTYGNATGTSENVTNVSSSNITVTGQSQIKNVSSTFLEASSSLKIDGGTLWVDGVANMIGVTTVTPLAPFHIFAVPTESATSNIFLLGRFNIQSGNASGTLFGANVSSSYNGDFLNFQVNSSTKFQVDTTGPRATSGTITGLSFTNATGTNLLVTGFNFTSATGTTFTVTGVASTSQLYANSGTIPSFTFTNATGTTVQASGQILIATTTNPGTGLFHIATSSPIFYVDKNGRVGIGTNTPSTTLDIPTDTSQGTSTSANVGCRGCQPPWNRVVEYHDECMEGSAAVNAVTCGLNFVMSSATIAVGNSVQDHPGFTTFSSLAIATATALITPGGRFLSPLNAFDAWWVIRPNFLSDSTTSFGIGFFGAPTINPTDGIYFFRSSTTLPTKWTLRSMSSSTLVSSTVDNFNDTAWNYLHMRNNSSNGTGTVWASVNNGPEVSLAITMTTSVTMGASWQSGVSAVAKSWDYDAFDLRILINR